MAGQAGWSGWLAWLPGLPGVPSWLDWLACTGWTGLDRYSDVAAHMARVELRERHQANLRHKLEMLKAHQWWQQLDLNKQVKCRRQLLRLG
jgi:hypothetical protein